jgi:alpha-L-fucosidase 2
MKNKPQKTNLAELIRDLQITYPERGCVSLEPAWKWDFGTVVGNGVQGALAFGRTSQEEFVLSHEELFAPLFPDAGYIPLKEHYAEIQQLVLQGKATEAEALIRKIREDNGLTGNHFTDPFVGASSLKLQMDGDLDSESYARSIDFETGEGLVAWRSKGALYHRQFFVSRIQDVVVIKLASPTGSKLNLSVGLQEIDYSPPENPNDQDIYKEVVDHCETSIVENCLIQRMAFNDRWEKQEVLGCCTVARVEAKGGSVVADGNRLIVSDAEELIILARTVPDRRSEVLVPEDIATALKAITPDYIQLIAEHSVIHGEIFGRCRLRLSDAKEKYVSGEDLYHGSHVGATNPAYVEKAFDGSRYGIIGSTGHLPPALQGVWTGTWKPCWSGDYTTNGNVQSMVASSLCGNHYECLESLMDYLDSLMDDFYQNARELLGFRGPLITWRSSTHGRTHYLTSGGSDEDYPGVFWFAGAPWFVQHYVDYYLHTGNEAFFDQRLKPFLMGCFEFCEDYLAIEKDGVYQLSPSSSPENQLPDGAWIAPNATMTVAAIKQLLRTLLFLQDRLGAQDSDVQKWKLMLSKMPPYQIGANGALKEWAWPGIENNEVHRHASHLYPLWFGVDPEIAASEELLEACKIAIDERTAFRRLENGGFMAFGFTQLGMAAAHLRDTKLAYESVEYLVNNYYSPVMTSQHNRYKFPDVLNMDISGGLPALIITMLVQSLTPAKMGDDWPIVLLPCLPKEWPAGSLSGVRCRGGFEVDISWKAGKLEAVKLTSLRGQPCRIEYNGASKKFASTQGEPLILGANLEIQKN